MANNLNSKADRHFKEADRHFREHQHATLGYLEQISTMTARIKWRFSECIESIALQNDDLDKILGILTSIAEGVQQEYNSLKNG